MRRGKTIGLLLVLLLMAPAVWAQTTGKISGSVRDADDGSPLPGVNVMLEGTTMGTASDINGDFVIIGIRPGLYNIIASFIGYTSERREGVQVSVDLTTTLDFELKYQVFESEDEIVVIADRDVVRKDLTSSEARVTAETIDNLPVQELSQVIGVQAGVTTRNGNLYIRGGRSSEVKVLVDGVEVTDGYDGSSSVQIENDGIQELQVISGTFNAEHGNAMSGVINVVTKEGRNDRWGGNVEVYSGTYAVSGTGGEAYLRGEEVDEFSVGGIQYRDIDPYAYLPINPTQYYNANIGLEGPIIRNKMSVFMLARYFKNDGWLYGVRNYNTDGTRGDGALVPMNTFNRLSWQGNLKWQLNQSMFLNVVSLGSTSEGRPYSFGQRWAPDGRGAGSDVGYDTKVKLTHLLSSKAFYTLDVASFFRKAVGGLYDDPNDPRYNDFFINPRDSIEVAPGEFEQLNIGGQRFARGGTDLGRYLRTTRSYLAKAEITSQLAKNHLVKAGLNVKIDDLALESYNLIQARDELGNIIEPFQAAIPADSSLAYQAFSGLKPITASAFIQDKIEYEDLIINVGLRLDYFDPRSTVLSDPEDPNIFNPFKKINIFNDLNGDGIIETSEEFDANRLTRADREEYWYTDATKKVYLSPRLGVAYPISELGVIHFSYGHFLQIPTLNRLFDNFGYKLLNNSGQYGPFGNPDLRAQKTIMYEIGLRQGAGDFVFDITAFYRDVRNWVSTSPLITTELPGVTYVIYANRDYANTRGLTVSLNRYFKGGWGADASYTFQVVEGSNSNPSDEFFSSLGNNEPTIALLPLDWDQRHRVSGSIYFGWKGFGGSMLASYGSGFPYTPNFGRAAIVGANVQPEFERNSRRMPSEFQVDMNLNKEFDLGGLKPKVFLQVFNLLDTRNVTSVYADTGRPDVTLSQTRTDAFDAGFYVRPEFYSEPRRMHVGLEFKF